MLGRLGARGEGGVGGKLRCARNSVPIYVILALRGEWCEIFCLRCKRQEWARTGQKCALGPGPGGSESHKMSRISQSELSVQLRLQINTLKALIRPFRFSQGSSAICIVYVTASGQIR